MKEIKWEYSERGDKSYIFKVGDGLLTQYFILFWDLKDKWYLSGDGIADYYSPIRCNSKEEADDLVRKQLNKLKSKIKNMLDEVNEYV